MELTTIQIVLIGILIMIVPIGLFNQIRIKKKKKALENYDYSNNGQSSSNDFSNDNLKNYILEYKTKYSRDSIKTALINSGNNEVDVEKYLNEFFDK